MRIGHGYDVHRLVEGRPLILGGVHIPYEKGLLGHSDADVLIHAVMDALLGALALGDIGLHFPDTDTRWMNADSRKLLSHVAAMLKTRDYHLVNLDATIVCQAPKLRPYIDLMRVNLASDLATDISNLSVKATTEEGLGISGAGGIAAHCVVLLEERKP
ncbi:MAG TPA: 2-C-methyl-D-erythritol 2,4-cyclodiphosphate synthase [Candidatus Cloacimonadota bacterium]|nr:2-C-methyl-D-erythritol 2,4-cyclodiphosphate synthase [Candidatus Cloacimonadota bacterium]